MKSKASATATRNTITPNPSAAASIENSRPLSGVLEHDTLDQIGDVFALVGHRFEELIDFLELDDFLGVGLLAEELRHRRAHDMVRIGLEPVDFSADLQDRIGIRHRFEHGYSVTNLLRARD